MKIAQTLAVLALALAPSALMAQQQGVEVDYNNPRQVIVGGVKVEGNTYFKSQQILSYSGLREGQEITIPGEEISGIVERLWLQRYFEDVAVVVDSLDATRDTAYFTIKIQERPRVSRWTFSGVKSGERKDIEERAASSPTMWRRRRPT